MKAVKKLAIAIAGLIGLLVLVGVFLPRTAHVERSITIDAPPAMVFTVLNGFQQFSQWSPWADIDPNATTKIEGPATGVGAKMSWSGNNKVGSGSQEILESKPYSSIRVRLVFGDFGGDYFATYTLTPEGSGTKVTWGYDGDYGASPLNHYFAAMAGSMLGPDYEKGLARLKALVEKMPKGDFSLLSIQSVETKDAPIVFLSIRSFDEPNAIGLGVGVAYSRLLGSLQQAKVEPAGRPVVIFRGREGKTLQLDTAVPVASLDGPPVKDAQKGTLPGGRAIKAEYRGSYRGLAAARQQVVAYLSTAGLKQGGPSWEQYVSDPAKTPEADLITDLYYPIE